MFDLTHFHIVYAWYASVCNSTEQFVRIQASYGLCDLACKYCLAPNMSWTLHYSESHICCHMGTLVLCGLLGLCFVYRFCALCCYWESVKWTSYVMSRRVHTVHMSPTTRGVLVMGLTECLLPDMTKPSSSVAYSRGLDSLQYTWPRLMLGDLLKHCSKSGFRVSVRLIRPHRMHTVHRCSLLLHM